LFARLIAELIIWANKNGMEVTCGDFYRSPRVFGQQGTFKGYGHKYSNHKVRLAADLNLFIDDEYMTATEDYEKLGIKWKSMHELCRWGGDFNDGNHFSLEHNGRK
jgi:hypothetical protein